MFQHHRCSYSKIKAIYFSWQKAFEEINSGDIGDSNTSAIEGVKVEDVDVSDIATPQEIKQSTSLAKQPCEEINPGDVVYGSESTSDAVLKDDPVIATLFLEFSSNAANSLLLIEQKKGSASMIDPALINCN
jgi:hypothetical protein